jgi:hypothetical protein
MPAIETKVRYKLDCEKEPEPLTPATTIFLGFMIDFYLKTTYITESPFILVDRRLSLLLANENPEV